VAGLVFRQRPALSHGLWLSLQGARALRDLARLRVDSTRITAPIRGNVSRPQLSVGNLVVADTTVLATINSSDPMCVGFDVDERTVLRLGRESRERTRSSLEPGLPVRVGLADEQGFPRRGHDESWHDGHAREGRDADRTTMPRNDRDH
jgi:multidrug efflux pump subunit AcrA (membrane-fusion protein)